MHGEKLWMRIPGAGPDGAANAQSDAAASGLPRRTFLQLAGFTAAAAVFSGCASPEQKIVPFLRQPVEMTPGEATWYASTCGGCSAGCGLLVKVRDGRPIKVEGNPDHPISRGGLCPVAHAMVFDLYDASRLQAPRVNDAEATWTQVDTLVAQKIKDALRAGKKVRLLTGTLNGPTTLAAIEKFTAAVPGARHVMYDPLSASAIREAHRRSHAIPAVPTYRFDRARLVVSFDADFLGGWISPAQHTRTYAEARDVERHGREMLRHVQVETRLSLAGANADTRHVVTPAEGLALLVEIAGRLLPRAGVATTLPATDITLSPELGRVATRLVAELWMHRGSSLVVSGLNDPDVQYLVNAINHALENYGRTLDLSALSRQKEGSDADMAELVHDMQAGDVGVLLIAGVNPAYDYHDAGAFDAGLRKVALSVSCSPRLDETSSRVTVCAPEPHFLERWDDAEPVAGVVSVTQPAIAPIYRTRSLRESLLHWTGDRRTDYVVMREHWARDLQKRQGTTAPFDSFWDEALRAGFIACSTTPIAPSFDARGIDSAIAGIGARAAMTARGGGIVLYEKVSLRDGRHASSPWLQELPDPLTKITWDNYACIAPEAAKKLGVEEGAVVAIESAGSHLEIPVHIQQGMHPEWVAIAVGYGRTSAGVAGSNVGVNTWPLVRSVEGFRRHVVEGAKLRPTGSTVQLATTQPHESQEGREIARSMTLDDLLAPSVVPAVHRQEGGEEGTLLWPGHEYEKTKWEMAIDLNACTGCGACVISCQAENNIPVVGKQEVINQREMHWMRIDRYFDGNPDNPSVSFQPMMCSQCDNASCENVCPVLATIHSEDGLNMQVYNRCVGTRYCANNCPLKTRRFNWFDYPHEDRLADLALNPDVTVRSRGIMEKCTFCVQRIQEARITARNEGRAIADGEIQTACQQSCPARAISFGNAREARSEVVQRKRTRRGYVLLEELNIRPAVTYLSTIRQTEEA